MIEIKGLRLTEKIYESEKTLVYRALRESDGAKVIVKTNKADNPDPADVDRLQNEYNVVSGFNSRRIIKFHSIMNLGNKKAIIMEDEGGISLDQHMSEKKFPLPEILKISSELSDCIGEIHRNKIVHNNINPSNIIINTGSGEIKIIDFGIASDIGREIRSAVSPEIIEGSLAYVSPEQTGRMNRSIDYRTDFYSLGVLFYRLLTGRLPFETTDAMELVHSHIAILPVPPFRLREDIPKIFSDIIMKLLAKNAEERYQSAKGLKTDLDKCIEKLDSTGKIKKFDLGDSDVSEVLRIPEKIYGRKNEILRLTELFYEVAGGSKKTVLISGPPGIGKSFLVNEIQKPLLRERGYFISGKFDRLKRDIPYNSFTQALKALVKQILTESEERIRIWKEELSENLGENASIMVDLIPELGGLVDSDSRHPADLPPSEIQSRVILAFQKFIGIFANQGHPLVIFFDDLQWADSESLDLMEEVIKNRELGHLFLIGSYRDNETGPAHPLMLMLERLNDVESDVNNINLQPLSNNDIHQLIKDTFYVQNHDTEVLSEIIRNKTGGNPLFIKEFITSLYNENYISFYNQWHFNNRRIIKAQMTNNVINLMLERIKRFTDKTQEALKIASCMGSMISLGILSKYFNKPEREVFEDLREAIDEGMIITSEGSLRFAHDRIQESIYTLLNSEKQAGIHYSIGKLMLDEIPRKNLGESIFVVVQQLNLGSSMLNGDDERIMAASLNLKSGLKAKNSAAFRVAFNYFTQAVSIIPPGIWKKEYDLALSLYSEMCESGYLSGNIDEAEKYFTEVIKNSKSQLDKIKVYETKIVAYTQSHRAREAIELGLEALHLLGFKMPRKPGKASIISGLIATKINLIGKKIEKLESLPEMKDPKLVAVARLLMACTEPSYIGNPDYLPIVVFKLVNLSLTHGNSIYSAYAYASYGVIISGVLGDIERGYKFGKLAVNLLDKIGAVNLRCKVNFLFGNLIKHWKDHIVDDADFLFEALTSGSESGDYSFASYSLNHIIFHAFFSGETLLRMKEKYDKYRETMTDFQQLSSTQAYNLWNQIVLNLLYEGGDPIVIKGELINEEEVVAEWILLHQQTNLGFYTVGKMILCYLFGHYEKTIEVAERGSKFIDSLLGMIFVPEYHFFKALACVPLFNKDGGKRNRMLLTTVSRSLKKLKKWSLHSPANYRHKYCIIRAELSAMKGRTDDAARLFDLSIEYANSGGFIIDEAIACERAGMMLLSSGASKKSEEYIKKARDLYESWNAKSKVLQIESSFPELFPDQGEKRALPSTTATISKNFDINTILKSTRAISGEIYLEKLLPRLISILVENAGAQRGVLMLEIDGNLSIGAESSVQSSSIVGTGTDSAVSGKKVPLSIINYVKRIQNPLIINDALTDPVFGKDEYVIANRVRSVLCLPLMRQKNLAGLIYLENNISSGAFQEERLEIINLLSMQATISLENSLLFEKALKAESELQRQYEEIQSQYEEMEALNEELEVTYRELSETYGKLEKESEMLSIFKKFADNSGQGLFMTDMSYKITYANASFNKMIRGDILTGTDFREFYDVSYRSIIEKEIIPSVISKGQWMGEIQIRSSNSSAIPILQNLFLIHDNQGKPHYIASLVTDMTDRKKIEEELIKASKIESLGVFAGGIAHDFNNYLTAIIGNCSLLGSRLTSDDTKNLVEDAVKAALRAKDLTLQLLTFSKGGVPVKKTASIKKLLTETTGFVLSGSKINCRFDIKEPLFNANIDEGQISQVIHNIVLNAAQAMTDIGTITVAAENAALDHDNEATLPAGDYIMISITDQGSGMDPEHKKYIFDPYFTTKESGNGLGLAVSYSIIKKHAGHIAVESKVGSGTTFKIYLPADSQQNKIEEKKPVKTGLKFSGKILVMDDDESVLNVAVRMLTHLGFKVDTAKNGEDAVEQYKKAKESGDPYTLTVMDLTVPGRMGGKETIKILRDFDPGIIAVVSSGYSNDPIMANYGEYGFSGVIVKPYRIEDLEKTISDINLNQ